MYKPWLMLTRVTKRCNANCLYCMRDCVTPSPDMSYDLYKYLVDSTSEYIKEVQPIGYGECILWPHMVKGVKYARDRGKRVVLYTNGWILTEQYSRDLMDAGLTEMRFSIESHHKDVFELLRYPLKFERVMDNIKAFVRIRNEGGYKCLTTYASCVSPENRMDIPEIRKYFTEDIGIDRGWFRGEKIFPRPIDLEYPTTDYRPFSETRNCIRTHKMRQPVKCAFVDAYMNVTEEGNMVPCCRDYLGHYVLGNVVNKDPLEVFNCQKYNELRTAIESGVNYPILCGWFCMGPLVRQAWKPKNYDIHNKILECEREWRKKKKTS